MINPEMPKQAFRENATSSRYTACLQAAQYVNDAKKQDHLMGCQCLAQNKEPVFYRAVGIFHSCKDK
jgi:hypothetical protein